MPHLPGPRARAMPATITVRTGGWGDAGYAVHHAVSRQGPIPCPECKGKRIVPNLERRNGYTGLNISRFAQ